MTFAELNLHPAVLQALADCGYNEPTPIQAQAIPEALAGHDLMASAQTGTGKTAAFMLPAMQRLATPSPVKSRGPRVLVLTPTRELATQVSEAAIKYGKHLPKVKTVSILGGMPYPLQNKLLSQPLEILVATPGRLIDHIQRGRIDFSRLEMVVLDEADRMLDMGFIRDIKKILALLPKKRQNLLFSATFSDEIKQLADGLLDRPGLVEVARRKATSELVQQTVHLVRQEHKRDMLSHLIRHHDWQQVLVFTRTKHGANKLAEKLIKDGIPAAAIHGNKSQSARTKALSQFKDGSLPVLVATDIAARGLDIDQLPQVVNFELPTDPEVYIHRIGRTGRADEDGWALSLCSPADKRRIATIARMRGAEPEWHTLGPLQSGNDAPLGRPMVTLRMLGGRKEKIRPGDVLGALTGEAGFTREQVGKITVTDQTTYVAVARDIAREAVRKLSAGKVKGKTVKVRVLED